jgi:hypothetical protein
MMVVLVLRMMVVTFMGDAGRIVVMALIQEVPTTANGKADQEISYTHFTHLLAIAPDPSLPLCHRWRRRCATTAG